MQRNQRVSSSTEIMSRRIRKTKQKYKVSPAQSLRRRRSRKRAKERRLERKNGIKRKSRNQGM